MEFYIHISICENTHKIEGFLEMIWKLELNISNLEVNAKVFSTWIIEEKKFCEKILE